MDIKDKFKSNSWTRDRYLQDAEMLADITLPDLKVRGRRGETTNKQIQDGNNQDSLSRPFTNVGTTCITSLASSTQALITPSATDWFQLALPYDVVKTFDDPTKTMANEWLATMKKRMLDKMAEHGFNAKVAPALERLFIEGQVLFHITDDLCRVLPMRSFIVKRMNGKIEWIIIEEQISEEVEHDNGGEACMLYTFVDYLKGTVTQQRTDQKKTKVVDFDPVQYVVVTTMDTGLDNYATSYGWRYYGTIKALNDYSRDLQKIIKWLAINLLCINPASPVTPKNMIDAINQGKDVLSCLVSDFELFSAASRGGKLPEIQFISAEIDRLSAELKSAFLVGIFGGAEPTRDRVTATEIQQRIMILDGATQALASNLMQTLQKPIAQAYLHITKTDAPIELKQTITPTIIAGSNKLSKVVETNALLGCIQSINEIASNNTPFSQQLDLKALFLKLTQANGIVDGQDILVKSPEQGITSPSQVVPRQI